jgi:hypothetical protein
VGGGGGRAVYWRKGSRILLLDLSRRLLTHSRPPGIQL